MSITSNWNTHNLFNSNNYKSSNNNKPKNTVFAVKFTRISRNTNWRHLIIDLTSLKTSVIKTAICLLLNTFQKSIQFPGIQPFVK